MAGWLLSMPSTLLRSTLASNRGSIRKMDQRADQWFHRWKLEPGRQSGLHVLQDMNSACRWRTARRLGGGFWAIMRGFLQHRIVSSSVSSRDGHLVNSDVVGPRETRGDSQWHPRSNHLASVSSQHARVYDAGRWDSHFRGPAFVMQSNNRCSGARFVSTRGPADLVRMRW